MQQLVLGIKTKLTQDVDEADNTNAAGVSLYYIIWEFIVFYFIVLYFILFYDATEVVQHN